jgi:cyclohexanone monooxygenase
MEIPLDIVICAPGFDSLDEVYKNIDTRGRFGRSLKEHRGQAPSLNMGVAVSAVHNMSMLLGPKCAIANAPLLSETTVKFVTGAIARADAHRKEDADGANRRHHVIETTKAGEEAWGALCDNISSHLLAKLVPSLVFGSNVPGKPWSVVACFGGLKLYRESFQKCEEQGNPTFHPF